MLPIWKFINGAQKRGPPTLIWGQIHFKLELIFLLWTLDTFPQTFLWEFGPGKLTSFISSLAMKLDFISQPSSKSTLPFAGLQHMQQCQVNFQPSFAPGFWSKWMVPEKWSPQWGVEPTTSQYEFSVLTTRPRLLVSNFFQPNSYIEKIYLFPWMHQFWVPPWWWCFFRLWDGIVGFLIYKYWDSLNYLFIQWFLTHPPQHTFWNNENKNKFWEFYSTWM